jgi:RimJ/RimL family protein N-acetyltransferase
MDGARKEMLSGFPIVDGDLTVRYWTLDDVALFAAWPGYPRFYEWFNLGCWRKSKVEQAEYFNVREGNPGRITFAVDWKDEKAVGFYLFVEIDWEKKTVGNMGIRVRPDLTDKGIGTKALVASCDAFLDNGFQSIRLDVAASNGRAARCYEKAGFEVTGEFWRDDPEFDPNFDFDDPDHNWQREDFRMNDGMPQVRFLWMERTAN